MKGALHGSGRQDHAKQGRSVRGMDTGGQYPFDASHRYMAVLHHNHERRALIHVKGAPERLIAMCANQRTADGGTVPTDAAYWHRRWTQSRRKANACLRSRCVRCPRNTSAEHSGLEGHLVLIGLVGLIDPPRAEAIKAVAECRRAGIRVKMITGDNAGTAAAIGRQIGLRDPGPGADPGEPRHDERGRTCRRSGGYRHLRQNQPGA